MCWILEILELEFRDAGGFWRGWEVTINPVDYCRPGIGVTVALSTLQSILAWVVSYTVTLLSSRMERAWGLVSHEGRERWQGMAPGTSGNHIWGFPKGTQVTGSYKVLNSQTLSFHIHSFLGLIYLRTGLRLSCHSSSPFHCIPFAQSPLPNLMQKYTQLSPTSISPWCIASGHEKSQEKNHGNIFKYQH